MTNYLGDFPPSSTVVFAFTTVNSSGAPTVLSGSPQAAIYKGTTSSAITAGVTLTLSYVSALTGANLVKIDTSQDTTNYTSGTDYTVALASGLVGTTSVSGYTIGHFSLTNRGPANNVSGVPQANIVQIAGVAAVTSSAQLGVNVVNVAGQAAVSSLALGQTNVVQIAGTGTVSSLALGNTNLVTWLGTGPNALVTGKVDALNMMTAGTAQSGAAGSVTLFSGAPGADSYYNFSYVSVISGVGAGQARLITGYTQATKVATVTPNWTTTPNNTSLFAVFPQGSVDLRSINGTLATSSGAQLGVNVTQWRDGTPNILQNGLVQVAIVSGGAAGSSNITQINGVAVQAASGFLQANLVQIQGVATVTSSAQLGVNVVNIAGQAAVSSLALGNTNVVQIAQTGTVSSLALGNTNLVTWVGSGPNVLQNGLVQAAVVSGTASVVGIIDANIVQINNTSAASSSAQLGVNVLQMASLNTTTSFATGNVNLTNWQGSGPNVLQNGLVQVAILSGGTSGGNITQINGVAVQAASGFLQTNLVQILGVATVTSSAQLGVNVVNIGGQAAVSSLALGNTNVVQIAQTGTVSSLALGNTNLVTWVGSGPNALQSGLVQAAILSGAVSSVVATVAANVTQINGVAAVTSSAQLGVNVVTWNGGGTFGTVAPDFAFTQNGTLQSGSSSTTITLASGSSNVTNFYQNEAVVFRSGLAAGESGFIQSYVAATKVATLSAPLAQNPSGGDTYTLIASGMAVATVSGIASANVAQWLGSAPNVLQSGLVQTAIVSGAASGVVNRVTANADQIAGTATVSSLALGNVNVINWQGSGPNSLQNGLVQVAVLSGGAAGSSNITQINGVAVQAASGFLQTNLVQVLGVATQTSLAQIGTNLVTWEGLTPLALTSGLVQSNATAVVSGTVNANLIQINGVAATSSGAQLGVNVTQWRDLTPAPLTAALVQTSVSGNIAGNVSGAVNSVTNRVTANADQIAGTATVSSLALGNVNVTNWQGTGPNILQNGLVQASILSGAGTGGSGNITQINGVAVQAASGFLQVNVSQWEGVAPAPLTSTLLVQTAQSGNIAGSVASVVATVTANATQIAGTNTVSSLALGNVNVTNWQGTGPNLLQNGLVQAAILSGTVSGTITANLTQINGVAATSSGAQLGVNVTQWRDLTPAPLTAALVQSSVSGNIAGNVVGSVGSVTGAVGSVTARVTANADQIAGSTVNALISGRVDSTPGQVQANAIGTTGFVAGSLATTVFATNYLTSALVDITAENAIADALLDRSNAIETGLTPRQALRLDSAAQGGKLSGAGTTAVNIWGAGVTTSRISATTDQSGNRLAVTLNL